MSTTAIDTQLKPLAILSLLGDSFSNNAATRQFRGRSVLARTLDRVRSVAGEPDVVVLVWDDQLPGAQSTLENDPAIRSVGPRRMTVQMNTANASLRWADGWRGGLLGVSAFDRGFDAKSVLSVLKTRECNAAILIDPNAAMIQPEAIATLIAHLSDRPAIDYAFLPGTPGSGAMILRAESIAELLTNNRLPGNLICYHPDRAQHDPLAREFAAGVSPRIARSLTRLTLDSSRQIGRISLLQSPSDQVETIVAQLQSDASLDAMPREIVLEINTVRATRPVFSVLHQSPVDRPAMTVDLARRIFDQLNGVDDLRLTFGGVGDPLLHDEFDQILDAARQSGIEAIHVETDLLDTRSQYLDQLARGAVDVVSVHLPAAHRDTYQDLMGVDRIQDVLEQLRQLVTARGRHQTGLPIVVPLFTKCERNIGEMEEWYDQWIRAVGAAVVRGPGDFGGLIDYVGVSDMLPPIRRPCRRLRSRMTILSDGTIASCEEDVLGKQAVGNIQKAEIRSAWSDGLQHLRLRPTSGEVCSACRMWDRP